MKTRVFIKYFFEYVLKSVLEYAISIQKWDFFFKEQKYIYIFHLATLCVCLVKNYFLVWNFCSKMGFYFFFNRDICCFIWLWCASDSKSVQKWVISFQSWYIVSLSCHVSWVIDRFLNFESLRLLCLLLAMAICGLFSRLGII